MSTQESKFHTEEVDEDLLRRLHRKSMAMQLLIGICLLAGAAWFGRHATDEISAVEDWIAGHGAWGQAAFIATMILCTSLFVPGTLFSIAAGAMYGLVWGSVLIIAGAMTTAAIDFLLARTLLRRRVDKLLLRHPKWAKIRAAAERDGLRLQLLLRLSPLNPVLVSYVLGASGTRWTTFMLATIGLIPGSIAEVYFGYLAKHVTKIAGDSSEHSKLYTALTVLGFAVCVVLLTSIVKMAKQALTEAEEAAVADDEPPVSRNSDHEHDPDA